MSTPVLYPLDLSRKYVIMDFINSCQFSPSFIPPIMRPSTPTQLIHQSAFFRRQSRFANAIENSTLALTLDPFLVQAWVERGIAKIESNDAVGALADFEQAVQVNPDYARAYFGRGWARGWLHDYDGEIEDAERFLRLAPHETTLYYQRLGNAYFGKGEYEIALTYLNRFLTGMPNDVTARYNRARLFYLSKKYFLALQDLDRLTSVKPKKWWVYYLRGRVHMALGNLAEAVLDFTEVIALRSEWAEPYHHRAVALFELGQFEDAEADLAYAECFEPKSVMTVGSEML
jgi:tetratricopeptide (TPR) repeat protein